MALLTDSGIGQRVQPTAAQPPPPPQPNAAQGAGSLLQQLMNSNSYQQQNALTGPGGLGSQYFDLTQSNQYATDLTKQSAQSQLQSLGIDQAALQRQQTLDPQLAAIQNQQFGLSQQGIGAAETEATRQYGLQHQNLLGQLGASGATNTVGAGRDLGDLLATYQNREAGLGRQMQGSQLQQKAYNLQQQESQKSMSDAAAKMGISKQDIQYRLQNALNQMGLANQMSVEQLVAEMNTVSQGGISQFGTYLADAMQLSGIPASAWGGQ